MKKFFRIMFLLILSLGIFGGVLLGGGILAGANAEDFQRNSEKSSFGHRFIWIDRMEDMFESWGDRVDAWGNVFDNNMDAWADSLDADIESWADDLDADIESWADNLEADIESWTEGLSSSDWNYKDTAERTEEVTFPAENLSALILNLDDGMAEISVQQGDEIQVSGMYSYDRAEYKEDSGKLEISRDGSQNGRKQEALKIRIPEKQLETVKLKCDSGILHIEKKVSAQEWKIAADSSVINAVLGVSRNIKIESDSSKITAEFPGNQDDYKIHMNSDSGIVRLGEESYAGDSQKGTFGDTAADNEMDIKADSSVVEIQFN